MILRASSLTVRFGALKILEDVNLHLSLGEILLIRGCNGIGKTTLLKTLAGLIQNIEVEIDYPYRPEYLSSKYSGLYLSLSARENIALHHDSSSKIIEQFKIPNPDIPTKFLSLGQKCLVNIAIALNHPNTILLIDETLNSLDQSNMRTVCSEICQHAAAAIIVSHNDLSNYFPAAPSFNLEQFSCTHASH